MLDGLGHLHAKGVAHRDLKPENFLVKKSLFFKVVITNFGLLKAMTDTTVLKTFCGTLKYLAPEAFPGICHDYNSLIDVWTVGVVFFKWLYSIPEPPAAPEPRNENEKVSNHEWRNWIKTWCQRLLDKLKNEEDDALVEILLRMIEIKPRRRWSADRCLDWGFDNGLFRRWAMDSLVVGACDPDEAAWQT